MLWADAILVVCPDEDRFYRGISGPQFLQQFVDMLLL